MVKAYCMYILEDTHPDTARKHLVRMFGSDRGYKEFENKIAQNRIKEFKDYPKRLRKKALAATVLCQLDGDRDKEAIWRLVV